MPCCMSVYANPYDDWDQKWGTIRKILFAAAKLAKDCLPDMDDKFRKQLLREEKVEKFVDEVRQCNELADERNDWDVVTTINKTKLAKCMKKARFSSRDIQYGVYYAESTEERARMAYLDNTNSDDFVRE